MRWLKRFIRWLVPRRKKTVHVEPLAPDPAQTWYAKVVDGDIVWLEEPEQDE